MEFRVPQYIEVEDKLFGPFTLMQFIYLVGGGGVVFLLWAYLPSFLAIIFIIPVAAFTWALVFFPKHKYGKSFTDIAEAAIGYFSRPRLYTWRKEQNRRSTGEISVKKSAGSALGLPKVSRSKLSDLSWSLDVSTGTSDTAENREGEQKST